ncbi:hypothetical protein [Pseudonocardia sp. HH130630-07]|uniref:hypothetical protein n=1 Tax=Pseudonocardia sp. HH130630-07 TaxID=1690815 RepID=UPI0008153DE7|nr:hypothetical protein [Pseudonocardia sp. HH130630-07]ANY06173.1 hypothetical protein AFB00_07520 [Pseudonocardia sp. HH130630-07]
MELDGYVDRLRSQFAAVSDVADDEVLDVAERLVAPLEATVRLVLLEALATAADEITLDLAPGSVHVRLNGADPAFVVTPPPAGPPAGAPSAPATAPAAPPPVTGTDDGPAAWINFRPPESLKTRIEDAAGRDGLSVNTWLTRVATAALDQPPAPVHPPDGRRRTGWFA